MEAMLERPSGKLWLGYNTAVLTDRRGDALGVILSFSDLTRSSSFRNRWNSKKD